MLTHSDKFTTVVVVVTACSRSEPIKRLSRHGFQDIDDSLAVGSTNLEYLPYLPTDTTETRLDVPML